MSFFSFFIIRSTLQRREFCVHSCITWYDKTCAKRALFAFFLENMIVKFVKICNVHQKSFYILFLQSFPRSRKQSRWALTKIKFRDTFFSYLQLLEFGQGQLGRNCR